MWYSYYINIFFYNLSVIGTSAFVGVALFIVFGIRFVRITGGV